MSVRFAGWGSNQQAISRQQLCCDGFLGKKTRLPYHNIIPFSPQNFTPIYNHGIESVRGHVENPQLRDFVLRCLEHEPERRLGSSKVKRTIIE